MNPKYGEKRKLCYMDAAKFIVYIKTGKICVDTAEDVEARFDTSNYEIEIRMITAENGENKKANEQNSVS